MKYSRVSWTVFILFRLYLKCVKLNERCSKAVLMGEVLFGDYALYVFDLLLLKGYQFYTLSYKTYKKRTRSLKNTLSYKSSLRKSIKSNRSHICRFYLYKHLIVKFCKFK